MELVASLVAQMVKSPPAMQEARVPSLGREDPLEKEVAIHSNTLACRSPRREEPSKLQSMGLQRLGCNLATNQRQMTPQFRGLKQQSF